MHRSIRILAAGGAAGLVAAGLLAAPALATAAAAGRGSAAAAHGSVSPAGLPLAARQLLSDRQAHATAAHATGSVTGQVQAPDGEPLAGICVVAYGSSGSRLGVTSASGRYFISDLRLGAYHLRYQNCHEASRYLPAWYGGATQRTRSAAVKVTQTRLQALRPVTLRTQMEASLSRGLISTSSPAATAASIATALGLPSAGTGAFRTIAEPETVAATDGHIAGTVTTTARRPLRGICVQAIRTTGNGFSMTSTGSNGHYTTGRLPAGRYAVFFFPGCGNNGNWIPQVYKNNPVTPTLVRVRAGQTTTGINAALALGGEISGTVTNASGKRLAEICVGPVSTKAVSTGSFAITLLGTGTAGTYHVHGVPPGSYKVLFEPCGPTSPYAAVWWHDAATYNSGQALTLKRGQKVTGINATMPVGGVISGTVTDAGNNPLSGICVSAQANTSDFITPTTFGQATTSATGQYEIEGLSAHSYQVQAQVGCGNNGDYVPAASSTLTVQLGGTYTQNFTMQASASVAGTVTSKATGQPVAGICVTMWSDSFNYGGGFAVTKADGTYVIDNQVPTGTYYVAFSGGCGNMGNYGRAAYDSPSPFSPAPIKVTTYGQAVTGIDGAVPPGALIGGTVTTAAGQKLTGICVAPVGGGFLAGLDVTSNGHYRVGNLQPGEYLMEFVPGCGNRQQNNAERDLVGAFFGSQTNPALVSARVGDTFGINARLVLGGAISGKVRTPGGKAVQLSCVALTGLSGAAEADSGLGLASGGTYRFGPLIPGRYNVTFVPDCLSNSYFENQWYKDKATPVGAAAVTITGGHTTADINSALIAGGAITGYVTSGGQPVRGMCVFAQNVTQFLDFGQTITNKTGHYVIRGLNAGRYELEIAPCSYSSRHYAVTLLTRIVRVTAPGRTRGVNLSPQVGGTISGQVLGDSPLTPQAGICAEALATNGLAANLDVSANGGKFSISNLPAGQYYVYLNPPGCSVGMTDLAPLWYPAAATQQDATPVIVTAGAVTTLSASTLPTDGAISGTVSAAGHPLAGACVIATSSLPGTQPVYSVSRSTGRYALLGLAPGSYEVKFSSGCGATGYKPQWWQNRNTPAGVTLVPVTAGTTTPDISASLHK